MTGAHETAAAVDAPWVALIPLLPLAGALLLGLRGERMQKRRGKGVVGSIAVATVGASFLLSLGAFFRLLRMDEHARAGGLIANLLPWIHVGSLNVDLAFQIDPLSSAMILVVTGIGALIHLYATAYMAEDPAFWRFFAYLNLFIFAMLTLVLGDNLLLMFVGWEGVGFCSWALIGFWHQELPNTTAANKAFLFNRIGDFGFVLGIFLLFWSLEAHHHPTLVFREMREHAHLLEGMTLWGRPVAMLAALFLFVGATGKSAQIPLYVWLPDAMAGPTPVSALIHAATMVTAGLYMIARMSFLFSLESAAPTMHVVATIGALTALLAATIATSQNDIKKVLAYSTVSQLGYMFLAMGVGAYAAGMAHVITHAFFKACLFLGSGSVIYAMHHEQDMRKMGGLKPYMPKTYWTFLVSTLAIAGFPLLAGFWSKDEILWMAYASPLGGTGLWLTGVGVAGLTACYMFRQVYMTFHGEPRWAAHGGGHGGHADADATHDDAHGRGDGHGHHATPHESPWQMTLPLVILAVGAAVGGIVCLPHWFPIHGLHGLLERFLEPVVQMPPGVEAHVEGQPLSLELGLMTVSIVVALAGIGLATLVYLWGTIKPETFSGLAGGVPYRAFLNKWYVDELYDATIVRGTLVLTRLLAWFDATIIDGAVNGAATLVRAVAWLEGLFDNRVVDGAVNGVADVTWAFGRTVKQIQTGGISAYLFVVVGGVLGGVFVYVFWAFAGTP